MLSFLVYPPLVAAAAIAISTLPVSRQQYNWADDCCDNPGFTWWGLGTVFDELEDVDLALSDTLVDEVDKLELYYPVWRNILLDP